MAKMKQNTVNASDVEIATIAADDSYQRFCEVIDIEPVKQPVLLDNFITAEDMANSSPSSRMTAALQVFVDLVSGDASRVEKVDRVLLDQYIAKIDQVISAQLDEIIHQEQFQQYESTWRSLKYLIDNTDFRYNIKVEVLDVDKETLRTDLEDAPDTTLSGLYKHVYVQEYDTPGGEPISAIISNFEFDSSAPDVAMLSEVAKISAASHCPFIASVGAKFFHKQRIEDLNKIDDLASYLERAEYIRWNSFRDNDDARYIGLTLPNFLLRLPYGDNNPVRLFRYDEQVGGETAENYLWGNASFAFAANMTRSFRKYGWTVNIRGPEAGGKVERLPLHQYDIGRGTQTKIPTEIIIPETRELEFANAGFIPLSYYKNSDFACFFSANSAQKPAEYSTPEATANGRINARLPYVFLSSRLGHYMKVIQRENIGSGKSRLEIESELNSWLQSLVTRMNKPGPELAATHPLRDGRVSVEEIPDNPGFYKIAMYAVPHFQIEGVDVKLSLVGQLPKAANKSS